MKWSLFDTDNTDDFQTGAGFIDDSTSTQPIKKE
jgi:hypothetical protein